MSLKNPFRRDHKPTLSDGAKAPGGLSGQALKSAVERALEAQAPLVAGHITKIRKDRPHATPSEVIAALDKKYLIAVGGTGAAAGGAAFVPGIGTAASLATGAGEAIAALNASVLYTLAVAEVHGLGPEDAERRKALVLAIVLGEGGTKLMQKATGGSAHWARELSDAVPLPKLGRVNQTLVRYFIRRFAMRQSALAFGRAMPLGAGAVIGAVGNVVTARAVIASAGRAFGPPPGQWPDQKDALTR